MITSCLSILKSSIFKRTIIYTSSSSLNALVAFLLLPILTRYLSPFDYGVVETFMALISCLTGVVLFGGNTLVSKEYFVLTGTDREEYIGNILGLILIAGSLLTFSYILLCLLGTNLSKILKISNTLIILSTIISCANAFIAMISNSFQLEKNAFSFAIFMNSKTIFEIVLSLYLIIIMGMRWDGRISGISVSVIIFALIALYLFNLRNIKIKFPVKYGKQILLMGAPLILSHLGGWVYGMVDKIMINNLISVDATGIYSVGYRFGMVVMMIETAFSLAWLPFFFENIAKKTFENNVKIVKATYIYIFFLVLFSIVYGFLGKYLVYFMVDERFFGSAKIIFLISIAYCFDGVWKMFLGYVIFTGRMKTYLAITLGAAVMQIALNYLFICRLGLIGAAWANFLSMLIGTLITIVIAVIIYPMPWLALIKREG